MGNGGSRGRGRSGRTARTGTAGLAGKPSAGKMGYEITSTTRPVAGVHYLEPKGNSPEPKTNLRTLLEM
jgi:hypothetical protein